MTLQQQLITVAMCVLGTALTRFLPFLIFAGRETPPYIRYLGRLLPAAVFSMLLLYCLRNITPLSYSYGIPELLSVAVTAGLHLWKRRMLLSVAGGTVCYMLLIQYVFVH